MTASGSVYVSSPASTSTTALPASWSRVDGRLESSTSPPCARIALASSRPTSGPARTRVVELGDQALHLLPRLPKNAALAAEKKESPLMRCAAHSARISEAGTPHTFSL